jgi:hypothetical protein
MFVTTSEWAIDRRAAGSKYAASMRAAMFQDRVDGQRVQVVITNKKTKRSCNISLNFRSASTESSRGAAPPQREIVDNGWALARRNFYLSDQTEGTYCHPTATQA